MADQDSGDYKVGYGKPPKEHQIQKGEVRNPRGRPKKASDIVSLINRELDRPITIKEGPREIRIAKREAIAKRLVNNALKGDPRSIEYLIEYCRKHGGSNPFEITAADRDALDAELARRQQWLPKSGQPDNNAWGSER